MLPPVDVGDVFERPDVLHRLPDDGVDRFGALEVVPGHLAAMVDVPKKAAT